MTNPAAPQCPEHEKMLAVKDQSQALGEFLEWCEGKGWFLASYPEDSNFPSPIHKGVQAVLADYFGIDLAVVEQEKRAMLSWLSTIQNVS